MHIVPSLEAATGHVVRARSALDPNRALLVAVSGIDASGKGFVTDRLAGLLQHKGLRVAPIHADGWLNLPHVRHSSTAPDKHFYEHAFRFDEMFTQLVEPLRETRSISLEADFAEETATQFRPERYEYDNVDVILLEAIFLLKREHRHRYDLSLWIDCTFATALQRALARGQEGLPFDATVRAYETIYFPAQRIHFERDAPRDAATWILLNDPRLTSGPSL